MEFQKNRQKTYIGRKHEMELGILHARVVYRAGESLFRALLEDYVSPEMPIASKIEIIKQLSSLLKPFEFVTKEFSRGKRILLYRKLYLPMVNCLKTELSKFVSKFDCINEIQTILDVELNRRFGNIEYNTHTEIATLLDPRFKNIHFQDIIACSKTIQKLRDLIKQDNNNTSSKSEAEESSSGQTDDDFWHHHRE